jgi:hypothetical protein
MGGPSRYVVASLFVFDSILLVNLGIGITQLDRNVTFQFIIETNGLHSTNRFHDCGLSMGDVILSCLGRK